MFNAHNNPSIRSFIELSLNNRSCYTLCIPSVLTGISRVPLIWTGIRSGALWIYVSGYFGIGMALGTGNCPKCGISDWKLPRHIRTRGVTSAATADLNIITCNKCRFTEFYELTEEELAPINKKAGMIFIFAAVVPTLIGIGVSIWLIWGWM